MEISHRTRTQAQTGQGRGLFLLSNRKGAYAMFGDNCFSHFCGMTTFLSDEWTLLKSVDDIRLDYPTESVVNRYHSIKRRSKSASEVFRYFGKTLYYEVKDYHGGLTVDLDIRRIYDNSQDGRIYKIYFEQDSIVVEYSKFADASCSGDPEIFYVVIKGTNHFTLLNSWEPRHYSYDESRGEQADRWIYRALRLEVTGELSLTFTVGKDKDQTLHDAQMAWDDQHMISNRMKTYAKSVKTTDRVAYSTAVFALESLVQNINGGLNKTGVFAGFPWFFQFWARDELISVQGLVLAEKYALVKDILMRHVQHVLDDGRLSNTHPPTVRGNADAIGWLWHRFGDLLSHLEKKKLVWDYFSEEELELVRQKLEESLRHLREYHEHDGLIYNDSQETWMDTLGEVDDRRAGARIEIQTLTLSSIKTLRQLYSLLKISSGKGWESWQKRLEARIRDVYLRDCLKDGADDHTIRSNLFIAAYVSPELLSKKDWVRVFHKALSVLWLDWGGIASLDKTHPWYCSEYAPQNDRSYHRGDSWYWVNNVAAIAMHRIAPEDFSYHIAEIKRASVNDLLWGGLAGHCSEVSSASRQDAKGCLAQAWSAATLVELLDRVGE